MLTNAAADVAGGCSWHMHSNCSNLRLLLLLLLLVVVLCLLHHQAHRVLLHHALHVATSTQRAVNIHL
jgi:hypothetical protein